MLPDSSWAGQTEVRRGLRPGPDRGSAEGYARVAALNRQSADLGLGFVDAAVVALAEALGLRRIATADRRRFAPLASALHLELLP